MNEDEFRSIADFAGLPVLSEMNSACESLERPKDPAFTGEIQEAGSLAKVHELLANPEWEPRGAIRYESEGDTRVAAIFWRRR